MPGRVFAAHFSPDGKTFVAGSSLNGQGEVRIYQTDDAKLVSKFEGQLGATYTLAYRPDGKQVAVAGFDGIVRIFDPVTGKQTKNFKAMPQNKSVVIGK